MKDLCCLICLYYAYRTGFRCGANRRNSSGKLVYGIEGPLCSEDIAWWKINHKGRIGWMPEGEGDLYWLTPAPNGVMSDKPINQNQSFHDQAGVTV